MIVCYFQEIFSFSKFYKFDFLSIVFLRCLFALQLEYDVLEYVVIERLTQGGREKLKDDGLNLSDWLQSLASFWGHLYVFLQL